MNDNMRVNVRNAQLGDDVADDLLGLPWNDFPTKKVERFKDRVRSAIADEARKFGAQMNVARALCGVVGPLALAQFVLARDRRIIHEKILGAPVRFRGELPGPRRWRSTRSTPLEVFEQSVPPFSPECLFVVAPVEHTEHEYERWVLLGRALAATGVTEAGVAEVFRLFRLFARSYHVLLDGRIQLVPCMPEWVSYSSVVLFTEERLTLNPHWVEPAQRARLAATAKEYHDVMTRFVTGVERDVLRQLGGRR